MQNIKKERQEYDHKTELMRIEFEAISRIASIKASQKSWEDVSAKITFVATMVFGGCGFILLKALFA